MASLPQALLTHRVHAFAGRFVQYSACDWDTIVTCTTANTPESSPGRTVPHSNQTTLHRRTHYAVAALLLLACAPNAPVERYGFITRLGNDTVSVESVTRHGDTETSDETDRFPRVRVRHTEIELGPGGSIRHLAMQIYTPSEPPNQQHREVVADVTKDSVLLSKKDGTGTVRRAFATNGGVAIAPSRRADVQSVRALFRRGIEARRIVPAAARRHGADAAILHRSGVRRVPSASRGGATAAGR